MSNLLNTLLGALESYDAVEIGKIIEERKPEDFEALQTLLSMDPSINPQHRIRAIFALGRWGDPALVTAIRNIIPHLEEVGRITAIDALSILSTNEAMESVLEYANDSSPHVRKFVIYALTRIDKPEAQAKLREIECNESSDYNRALASKNIKRFENERFEMYSDAGGKYRFRIKALNDEIIAMSDRYETKEELMQITESIAKKSIGSKIIDLIH